MPRPNPPRRRPRQRRRNPNVVKVPQQLREQNGEDSTEEATTPPQRSARAAVRATTPATTTLDTTEWSRRSLYVLVALMAVTEVLVSVLVFTFSKVNGSLGIYLLGLSPYALLASAFIAMPVAKRITLESRYLRVVETAMVAVFIFFLWYFFLAGAGSILESTGNVVQTKTSQVTPCPSTATSCTTPAPSPSPSSGPSASASASASATSTLPVEATGTTFTVLGVVDILPFVLTPLIFYPVYRRLRFRGRMGAPPGGRAPPSARKR
jgi:hypothetical protein